MASSRPRRRRRRTLTFEVSINGVVSLVDPGTEPGSAGQPEPSSAPTSPATRTWSACRPSGITLAITSCSFADNVGTIQATAQPGGISVPYVVRFIYGS